MLRVLGHKAAKHAIGRHARKGGLLDVKYGFSLLRDRRISFAPKLLAIAIGIAVTALLMALEAPLELILGLFLPLVGFELDLLMDGVEVVLFPLLVACIVLPRLVRQRAFVSSQLIDMPPPMLDR
jgi:hypothetical protein